MAIDDNITPTEYLVMEVLVARWRLGEISWPFPNFVLPALRRLQDRGMIDYQSNVVEKTQRAWMTQAGMDLVLHPDYIPPNEI